VLLLKHENSGVDIDLSFGALPFERELIDRAEFFVVNAVTVKVATPEDLIVTKAVAQRAKDIVDIETILNIREDLDLSRVRSWVRQFADALETPEVFDTVERLLLAKQKLKR
jgi:predicted nucleotidyltransferase